MSFYHSTPIGRILNRFTRDINAVEAQLHTSFAQFIRLTLAWLNSFVLTSYSNPWVLVAVVPIGFVYILILVIFGLICFLELIEKYLNYLISFFN